MKASIGDRLIVEGTRPGTPRRDGRIVAVHHADGSPPRQGGPAQMVAVTGQLVDPGALLGEAYEVASGLHRSHQQRRLGRVAEDRPLTVVPLGRPQGASWHSTVTCSRARAAGGASVPSDWISPTGW